MDDDDERLLERIQEGDGESFGVLYDRTWRWLMSCVVSPRVGPGAAEDVLAETYRTVLDRVGSFEWRGVGLLHWLAAIARRKCLERLRKDGRAERSLAALEELESLPNPAPSAEAEMIRAETLRHLSKRVRVVLGALHTRYAEVLQGKPVSATYGGSRSCDFHHPTLSGRMNGLCLPPPKQFKPRLRAFSAYAFNPGLACIAAIMFTAPTRSDRTDC